MAKKKFYAVKKGRQTEIFESWEECKVQVDEFRDARFKSFATYEQAETWLYCKKTPVPAGWVAYTDGSQRCGGAILLRDGVEVARAVEQIEVEGIHNNLAELKGIELAVRLAKQHGATNLRIFSDSNNAINWLKGKWKRRDEHIDRAVAALLEILPPDVRLEHIGAHQNDYWNEEVDKSVRTQLELGAKAIAFQIMILDPRPKGFLLACTRRVNPIG